MSVEGEGSNGRSGNLELVKEFTSLKEISQFPWQ